MKIDRYKIHSKYYGKCAYCGVEIQFNEMQVDHIIPKSDFRSYVKNKFRVPKVLEHLTEIDINHIDNLNPSCRVCNKWKSSHDLELFRKEIGSQIKRLNEYSSNYRMAKKYNQLIETQTEIKFYFETL